MADKRQFKADKIVSNALGLFTKAIDEIDKAQAILEQGIEQDQAEEARISKEIDQKYTQLEQKREDRLQKDADLKQNESLKEKLKQFTK
ncbi:hypothetical protein [Halobacillus karajensis]|uniref:hypothetical protein n=1 Tax=Halobacillus karajensis TaxID=195088 RepID=UPI00045CDAF4|nr:hypothetical protein [Halobacillus karajensis]CDQ21739.1 hypothetical protein BN982_04148 [Halobacillus karajensis]